MAFELQMLALMTLVFALAWLPASIARYRAYGVAWLFSNRSSEGLPSLPEWGQRAERAYDDLRESFPAFAVAVLLLALTGGYSRSTSLAAALFVAARLLHFTSCLAGAAEVRILCWGLGLLATLYLLSAAAYGLVVF